jgi:uncharacterized membrane protein YkvA (DUF1232 family)
MMAIAWIIGAVLYLVCPLDGDWIPVVGWIDDAFVAWLASKKVRDLLRRN